MSLSIQKNNRISQIISSVHRAADTGVTEIKKKIAEDARNRAPVASGELRDSIQLTLEGVEAAAPHALFVEVGTEKTSPQPFLTPAVQDAESNILNPIREALK
jgi:HK97 gp10 family phage protein